MRAWHSWTPARSSTSHKVWWSTPIIPALGESETQGYIVGCIGDFQANLGFVKPGFKTKQFNSVSMEAKGLLRGQGWYEEALVRTNGAEWPAEE